MYFFNGLVIYCIRYQIEYSLNQLSTYFYDLTGHNEEYNGETFFIMTTHDKKSESSR